MISLRRDEGGDRWGEWYHFFGIFAYAMHERVAHGKTDGADFVARMNKLLNPLLVGEPEEPAKAQLDRDSIEVARAYLKGVTDDGASCADRSRYVASGL